MDMTILAGNPTVPAAADSARLIVEAVGPEKLLNFKLWIDDTSGATADEILQEALAWIVETEKEIKA